MIFNRTHHIYLVIFACLLGNSSASFAQTCVGDADDLSVEDISLKWSSGPGTANSHGQPFVADLDNDGSPEVIVTNEQSSTLNILDGIGNGAGFSDYDGIAGDDALNLGFKPYNTVAIANLGIGNHASIVIAGYTGTLASPDHKMSLWSYDGTSMVQSWIIDLEEVTGSNAAPGTIGISDFDGNGTYEIYFANVVLKPDGSLYAKGTDTDWPISIGYGSLALDVLGDGNLELITGGKIWSVSVGTLTLLKDINDDIDADAGITGDYYVKTWRNSVPTAESRVMISAADYDLDGDIDLLFPGALGSSSTDPSHVFLWDPTGTAVSVFKPSNNHNRGTGRIAIGDTDGDGGMNALFVSGNKLINLNENFQLQWDFTVTEGSATGYSGVTLYDFDGDGKSEILYRDRNYFKTFSDLGATAQTILEVPCKSYTREEYPIVADLNNDGQAEICFSCLYDNSTDLSDDENINSPLGALRAYGASNGSRWQPTRGVWNQHAYMNVNIEDDLSVATTQNLLITASRDCYDGNDGSANITGTQNKPLNMFMSQAPLRGTDECPSFALPDLIIGGLSATTAGCPDTNFDLTYTLTNQGDVSVSGALPITFYSGDPSDASATKLNTVTVNLVSLAKNATANYTSTVIGLGTNDFDWESNDLYVVINESGALPPITPTAALIPECDVSNNSASLNINYTNFDLSPTTGDGPSLTLTKVSDNIKCDDTKPDNGEVQVYYNGSIGGSTQTIFNEDFEDNSLSNLNSNNLTDPSGNWSAFGGNTSATTDFYGVGTGRQTSGKTFIVNNGTNAVILETKSIDIATYTDVEIDIDAFTNNSLEVSGAAKDEIEVYYSIDDAAYEQVNTANTLLGSFSYKHVNQSGLSGNTLKVKIEITNNDAAEYTELDNISITGTLPANDTQHTESSGFEFLWYAGAESTQDYSTLVHTGSSYTGMADGTYTVRGRYISGNCFSEALDVTINLLGVDNFSLVGWEAQSLTDCLNPNGIAQAGVKVGSDTITLNYEFTWYLSSEGVTALGTGYQLSNRTDADYKLVGVSTITGCSQTIDPVSIITAQTLPDQPTVTVTDVLSCDDVNTGELEASLPDDGNTYSYQWYSGRVVKPTADFNESLTEPSAGDTYALIPAGPYTVVAVNMLTKCQSNQLVVEVGPPDNYPTPELILDNANTSCDGNGQITARNGNGDVDWDLAANTFTFFDGNNTLVANRLGSAGITGSSTNNVASGLLDGMHTVQVTHTASGCTSTDTLTVPNQISEPVFNFTQTNVDTDGDNVINRCESTTNLALTGTTNSSSQTGLKARLNDEDFTTVFISDATQDNEWIEIDLGAVKSISDILIFNNTSAALNRIQNVRVMVSSSPFTDTGGTTFGNDLDGFVSSQQNATFLYDIGSDYSSTASTTLESVVTVEAETSGRYLRVQKSGINLTDNILNITEIQVFEACTDGIEAATIHKTSCGTANGSIDLTGLVDPTAGTTYSYTLYDGNDISTPSSNTTGASTGIFTGLAAATYTVLAEESNTGCSTSQRVLTILDKPDKPFVTTTIIDDLGCSSTGTGSVSVTAKMMGSDEPGSYNFDLFTTTNNTFADDARVGAVQNVTDGTVGFTFGNLVDGTYSLRVTNADQTCYAVETIIIDNISVDPLINTDASTDNTGCSPNNGTIIISDVDSQTGNDLQANYTFSWVSSDNTDVTPTDANKNVLDALGGDTYTVTITSNTTGCSVNKDYVIPDNAIYPSLSVVQISASTYCDPSSGGDGVGSATVVANGVTYNGSSGNYTFNWYDEDPDGSSVAVKTVGIPTDLTNDDYWIKATNAATGCVSTVQQVTIDLIATKPIIVLADSASNTSCDPSNYTGSITVDVTLLGADEDEGDYTFTWTGTSVPAAIAGYTRLRDYTVDGITHRYFLHRTSSNTGNIEKWPDARDQAEALGGYLFIPNSEAEQLWVAQDVRNNSGGNAWIGINDINTNHTWVDVLNNPIGVGHPVGGIDFVSDITIDDSKWPRNKIGLRGGDRFMWNDWYEPNDSGDEDFAHFWGSNNDYWNDIGKDQAEYAVIEFEELIGTSNKLDSIGPGTYTVTAVGPNGCDSDPFSVTIHNNLPVIDVGFKYNLSQTDCTPSSANTPYNDINGGITIVPTIIIGTDSIGATNWALAANGATITMSSTITGKEGQYAIDNDTDGVYGVDSVDIAETTGATAYDYIDIVLSEPKSISDIIIWNVEDQNSKRLENVQVMVSANPFTSGATLSGLNDAKANSETIGLNAGGLNLGNLTPVPYLRFRPLAPEFQWGIPWTNYRNAQITIDKTIRYIRLQKTGDNPGGNSLSIAEIQIFGTDLVFEFELQTVGGDILDGNGETSGYRELRYKTRGPSTTITGLKTGSYRMNLTDSEGTLCSNLYPEVGSFQIVSNESDIPVIDATGLQAAHVPNTSCQDPIGEANAHPFVRGGSGNFDFEWRKNGTIVGIDSVLIRAAGGDYSLKVTDKLTSCTANTSITIDEAITVVAAVESNLQHNSVCDPNANDATALDYNGTVSFTPTTNLTSSGNYTFALRTAAPATVTENALDFDGDNNLSVADYVQAPDGIYFDGTDFSVEVWVFLTKYDNWTPIIDFGTNPGSNNIQFCPSDGMRGTPIMWLQGGRLTAATKTPLNVWSHLAYTFNSTSRKAKLYLNGLKIAEGTMPRPNDVVRTAYIGKSWWAPYEKNYPGKLDELRIWNVERSAADITSNMNNEIEPSDSLELYLRFNDDAIPAGDDNTGISAVLDYSGRDLHADLYNFDKAGPGSNWVEGYVKNNISSTISGTTGGAGSYSEVRYDISGDNSTVTGLPEGDYVMTVTDVVTGCTDEYDFTILLQPNANFTSFDLTGSVSSTPDQLCNAGNGTIVMDFDDLNSAPANGSGSYTVKYYEGNAVVGTAAGSVLMTGNGTAFTGLEGDEDGVSDGVYTVVVIDGATGCSTAPETFIIGFEPDKPDFTPIALGDASSPTHDNSVCDIDATSSGLYNGQITIVPDVLGTEANYTYDWFVGVGTSVSASTDYTPIDNVLSNVPAGTYTLQVTSIANGCDTMINFTIANDYTIDMILNPVVTHMDKCEGNALYPNGGIDVTVSGGSGNYAYEWFHGSGADDSKKLINTATIFTQKGTTGTSTQNVSGATTAGISFINGNGNAGAGTYQYTVKVLDTDRGCYETATVAVGITDPGLSVTAEVLKDNYSCDASSPTGSVGINVSAGAVTPQFEWYSGVGVGGVLVGSAAIVTDLDDGIYTVKFIDGNSNCFVTDQVTIGDYTPTVTAASNSNTAQTVCNPADGTATVGATISFVNNANSVTGNPDDGWTTANYTYQWYLGTDTSTPLSAGVDPGNGSTPADVTLATVTGLAADNYTVEITETNTSCTQTKLVTVADGTSAGAPDLGFFDSNLPASCLAIGSFQSRLISNPTGHTFAFEYYEGAQDHTLDAVGTGLATGDQLIGNPGQSITVLTNSTAASPSTFSDNEISDIMSKPYTVVVTDQTTGCRYQEYYSLGYVGQQTTTTLTVENVDECPDNGVARVGLADYVDNTNAATITNTTGFNAGQFDDISEYILYLYSGTGVPADQEAPYVVNGLTFPFLYDGETGIVRGGDGAILIGSQAGPGTLALPVSLIPGESAKFRGLPAGDYIAIAREQLVTAWDGATNQCWSAVSFDKELVDLAYAPILSGTPVITSNTNCDVLKPDGGNGQLSITVAEDPAENLNDASDQQPAGYIFTWKNSGGVTVKTESIADNENPTSTTNADLVADTYTVTIQRAHQNSTLTYTSLTGTFEAGEKLNLSGTGTGSGYVESVGGGSIVIYETNGTFANGVTLTGATSGATATQSGALVDVVGLIANGCELIETIILDDDPEQHVVSQVTTVDYNNCNASPISTITISDSFILADGVGQPAADYTYEWFKAGTTAGDKILGQTGSIIDLSALAAADASFIIADRYYVVATNISNGCISTAFEVNVIDNTSAPVVSITASTADTSCKAANEGSGDVTFVISTPQLNSAYTYQWYAGVDASGPALTDGGTISGTSGTLNGAANGNYTATLSGMDGGSYTLVVTDATIPNNTCATTTTTFINEDISKPTLVASNYSLQDNQNCSSPNGFFEIATLSERGSATEAVSGYEFRWFEIDGTTAISGTLSDVSGGTDNRVDGLIGGTYKVEIKNKTTFCSDVLEFLIEDQSVNPIINLVSSTDDAFCINTGYAGDGTLTIEITDEGAAATLADFSVEWYRGRLSERRFNETDSVDFLYDDAGTVPATGTDSRGNAYDFASTRGDAAVGGNILTLTGLSYGDYTVFISKNNSASDATGQNYGCETLVTYYIDKNSPYLSINHPATPGGAGSYAVVDNTDCSPLNGSITLSEVLVDGVVVNLVDSSPYDINWVSSGSGTLATSNVGVSIADDQLTLLDSTTYTYTIANNITGCSTELISVDVESEVSLPFLSVVVAQQDIVCDDATYTPTGEANASIISRAAFMPSANYSFTWYADAGGTTPLTGPAIATGKSYFYDSLGVAVSNGDPGATVLKNISEGTYYVQATDLVTPDLGCTSTPMQSVIIPQFESTILFGSIENTDFIRNNPDDCDPFNGSFEILRISETRPLGQANFTSTTMTDYTINWYESVFEDSLAENRAVLGTVTTSATFPSTSKAAVLPAGKYYFKLTNTSNTGCAQSDSTMSQFVIIDESVDPAIEFVSATNSNDCLRPLFEGDGTASISLPEDESNYTINWFREDTVGAVSDVNWLFGSSTGGSGTNVGTAASNAGSYLSLVGLADGFYTVEVSDKVTPGIGCINTLTLQILNNEVNPFINIPESQIVDNTRCDLPGNGAILITSDDISLATGSSNLDDFNWFLTYDDGDSTTVGVDTVTVAITGAGAASQISMDSLSEGSYAFIATSPITFCASGVYTVDILGRGIAPVINDYTRTPDADCAGDLRLGLVEITSIDSFVVIPANYDLQWFVGADTLGTTVDITYGVDGTSNILSGIPEGNYTVRVINTDNGNCTSMRTVLIENEPIYPIIEDFYVSTSNICPEVGYAPGNGYFELASISYDGVTITDSTTLSNDYTLEFDITLMTDYDPTSPFKIDSLAPGTYSVYIRRNDSDCRSEEVTTFTIGNTQVDPIIIFDQIEADSTCSTIGTLPNGILVAKADGSSGPGYSFQWSDVSSTPLGTNDTLSDLYAATYQLVVTDSITKCSATSSYPLTNVPFEFDIDDYSFTDPTVCDPTNGILEVTSVDRISTRVGASALTYQFYEGDPANGGVLVQDDTLNVFSAGVANTTYLFQATNPDYGCSSGLVQVFLSDSSLVFPVISLATNDFGLNSWNQFSCDPLGPTGRLSVAVDDINDNPDFTYAWIKIEENSTETPLPITTAVADSLAAGTYRVTATNIITQCQSSEEYSLIDEIQNPLVVSTSASSNINCLNPNGQMGASVLDIGDNRAYKSALDGYTYYWFEGLISETSPDVSLAKYIGMTIDSVAAGIYTVYAVDNTTDCFTSDPTVPSSVVEVEDESTLPDLSVDVVNDLTICDPTMADGFAEIIDSEDQIFKYTIAWYTGIDTTQSVPFQYGTFADSLLAGDYLTMITNNITGCVQFESFTILDLTERVPAPNAVVLSDRTHCEYANGHAAVSVLGETDFYEFNWYLEADPRTVAFTGTEIDQLDTATYRVVAQNLTTTCYSEPTQITINNGISDPVFRVEVKASLCNRTEDGSVNQFTGGASIVFEEYHTIDSISWINEQAIEINYGDPKAFVLGNAAPGKYTVYFKPENGCLYEANFIIDASITVYNGLSANDDGNNDFFLIDCADFFEDNNVKILNTEGALIYEVDGYDNFNNRFEGYGNIGNSTDELPVGTYYYMIDKGDGSSIINGFLELVR